MVVSPLSPTDIKDISLSSKGVTLELDNGKRISVTPKQLAKMGIQSPGKSPGKKRSSRKYLNAVVAPAVWEPDENIEANSLQNMLADPKIRMSITNLLEERNHKNMLPKKAPRRSSMPSMSTKGKDRLGRVQEDTRHRHSLPTLDGCSTHECLTILIDPGDLMKIHGFKSKPKMNGATVEVIRKSRGTQGKRWDVRVVSEQHIAENASFNAKRLISVAAMNLKHFL